MSEEAEDTQPKLAACPCCSAPGYLITDRRAGTFKIKCTGCEIQTKASLYRSEVITAWNTRSETALADARVEIERLRVAISWIEPPFIDKNTSEEELRSRINLCVSDAKRAALSGEQS